MKAANTNFSRLWLDPTGVEPSQLTTNIRVSWWKVIVDPPGIELDSTVSVDSGFNFKSGQIKHTQNSRKKVYNILSGRSGSKKRCGQQGSYHFKWVRHVAVC